MGIKSSKQVDRRSSETESYSIFSLPEHVIIKILCMLDNWSLTRAVCTCPTLRRIAYNSVKLWRHSVVNLARLDSMSERTALSIKYRGIPAIELSEWRLGTRKSVSRKRFLKRMLKVIDTLPISETDTDTFMLSNRIWPIIRCEYFHSFDPTKLVVMMSGSSHATWKFFRWSMYDFSKVFPQLEQLTFIVNLEDDSSYSDSPGHSLNSFRTVDFGYHALYGLDKLRDLTIGKTYHHFSGEKFPQVFHNLWPALNVYPLLERLHIYSGKLSHNAVHLKEMVPQLKHLHLGQLIVGDSIEQDDQLSLVQSLLDGFTSLTSFQFKVQDDIRSSKTLTLPESVNAVGVCGPVPISSLFDALARLNHSNMIHMLEVGSTSDQDKFMSTSSEQCLVQLLEKLRCLEILILSRKLNIIVAAELSEMIRRKTTLSSVIGIELGIRADLPAHVRYITATCGSNAPAQQYQSLLCRSSVRKWAFVEQYSSDWHEAFGTAFFYPASSINRSYGVVRDFLEVEWKLHEQRCKEIDENHKQRPRR